MNYLSVIRVSVTSLPAARAMAVWLSWTSVFRPDSAGWSMHQWQIDTRAALSGLILALTSSGRLREIERLIHKPKGGAL
jgi:hypothetical protein